MTTGGPSQSIYPRRVIQEVGDTSEPQLVFVLQPMAPEFDPVLAAIREIGAAKGLAVRRADDIRKPGAIMTQVVEEICKARVVIADLTGPNANVFYEMGIGHAIREDLILLTQDINSVPFDLRHLRLVEYSLADIAQLARRLSSVIDEVMNLPAEARHAPATTARTTPNLNDVLQRRNLVDLSRADFGSNSESERLAIPGTECEVKCQPFAVLSIVPTAIQNVDHDELWSWLQQRRVPRGRGLADGDMRPLGEGILITQETSDDEHKGKLRRYALFDESGYFEWGRCLGGCYKDVCIVRLTPLLVAARDMMLFRNDLRASLGGGADLLVISVANSQETVLSHLGNGWSEPFDRFREYRPKCSAPHIQIRIEVSSNGDELLPLLKGLDRRINRYYGVDENRGFIHPSRGDPDSFGDTEDPWEPY